MEIVTTGGRVKVEEHPVRVVTPSYAGHDDQVRVTFDGTWCDVTVIQSQNGAMSVFIRPAEEMGAERLFEFARHVYGDGVHSLHFVHKSTDD